MEIKSKSVSSDFLKFKLKEYAALINNALINYLHEKKEVGGSECSSLLNDAVSAAEYSLMSGGKRIRGILILEFCRILGGDIRTAVPLACAMEMIHCASLIQDDMPCMDDDDFRRGAPSCHKKYGEASALLASDVLLLLPFEIIAGSELDCQKKVLAIQRLALGSGISGMTGGQIIDLKSENRSISFEELKKMHSLKTGALIRASCELGAIAAGADRDVIAKCAEYGEALGLAFQIRDDILDVMGESASLGKPAGSDAKNNKTNYITLFGVEKSKLLANETTESAKKILNGFLHNEFLSNLTDMLLTREN